MRAVRRPRAWGSCSIPHGGGDKPVSEPVLPLGEVNAYLLRALGRAADDLVAGMLTGPARGWPPPDRGVDRGRHRHGQLGLPAFALGHVADREQVAGPRRGGTMKAE